LTIFTTRDGTDLFYKDWGQGQPIVFHHGWPLTADDWDTQMLFFLQQGYRVVAHDRRGHGRSSQTWTGNDMDTYADDVAALMAKLDIQNAVHIGHSTGGGEVVRYLARHGSARVAKAVLIGAIPPIMLRTERNPGGLPMETFDAIRRGVASSRAEFYKDITIPFFGSNRPDVIVSDAIRENWVRQALMGAIKSQYDCIAAFSETDFTDDLTTIDVPTLVMHGDDDQLVPIDNSARLTVQLLLKGTLKIYPGLSHGMATTHPEVINPDLLEFVRG
jgi:non-heme chloroperoxidase